MISVHGLSLSYSLLSAFRLFFFHPLRTTCKYRYRQQAIQYVSSIMIIRGTTQINNETQSAPNKTLSQCSLEL
ncbi:hypothetical protein EV421DRAFT_1855350, partial [Armillaria borealis]